MQLLYPVSVANITQGFGENAAYYADESRHPGWRWPGHNGLDFGGSLGDPILAAAGGVVSRVAFEEGGYGHFVRLTHPNGWMTYYAHLSRVIAALDQPLVAGEVLGEMGASGCADGVHLHFGLRLPAGAAIPGAPAGYDGYTDPSPYFASLAEPSPEPLTELVEVSGGVEASGVVEGSRGGSGTALSAFPPQGCGRVCVDVLNVRAAPGLDAAIVGALYAGALFAYDGVDVREDVTWLAFAGLYAAAAYRGAQYVTVIS